MTSFAVSYTAMPFQLFKNDPQDPPRCRVSFNDLDNKAFWCNYGQQQEVAFVNVMQKIDTAYDICIHPKKQIDPYYPDLLCVHKSTGEEVVGEVKIKNSPLFYASKKYNVPPQYALTMDIKDSYNYAAYLKSGIDILIYIWVKWEAHEMITQYQNRSYRYQVNPMKGVWQVPFSRLRQFEIVTPPPIHWYKEPFRHPPLVQRASKWGQELITFDERLEQRGNQVKSISSNGYIERNGRLLPSGHSSCSYVFNLKDADLFDEIVFREY